MTAAFRYEREMLGPAVQWLRGQGLMVKKEFPTPWGICDLVGCSLNRSKVRQRLKLRQGRPIRSQLRVYLLSLVPDEEEARTIDAGYLYEHFGSYLDRARIDSELARLVKDRFVEEAPDGTYFKRNGWMPLHKRLVAVELKLTRIEDALHQAINNLGFADESYVGLPADMATRILKGRRKAEFIEQGVGFLALKQNGCRAALLARKRAPREDTTTQTYSVERFWSIRPRGSKA